jgi:HAD superfamily hydrolase (TIGR01509 family)
MKPARKIPLFDLGNVVVKVDFAPFTAWLTERSASKNPSHALAIVQSSLWLDFEFGRIGREEFARRLSTMFEAEFTVEEVEHAFCAIFPGLVPGMPQLLRELAQRGPVFCLSNTNEVHLSWLRRQWPESLESFTRVFASHEMNQRKPDPGIYLHVAEALQVRPRDVVFFDDVEANVAGAKRAGFDAHLFSDTASVREVLKGIEGSGDNRAHGGT